MRSILSEPGRSTLFELAHANTLLAFDYDGTLAPLSDDRASAAMRTETRDLLAALARRYPCAVLSGRTHEDLQRRLTGVDVVGIVGNQGIEPWHRPGVFAERARRWREALQAGLAGVPGVVVEDKTFSVAVHYRGATDRALAREQVLAAAVSLPEARLVHGKDVLNVLPAEAPTKGDGLELLRERAGCDRSLYVGDDASDEEAFALAATGRVVGVRVEPLDSSLSAFFINGQAEVDELLRRLLDLRPAATDAANGRVPALGEALELTRLLWAIDQALHDASESTASRVGLTAGQVLALRLLDSRPGLPVDALAALIHSDTARTTSLVDGLITSGLVECRVDPAAPGRPFLHLTEAGAKTGAAAGLIETAVGRALATTHALKVRQAREVLVGVSGALRHAVATAARRRTAPIAG